MKEVIGNIWNYHKQAYWIVITTNGMLNKNGELIMGAGIALEAKKRFPELPKWLGTLITAVGNGVFIYDKGHIIAFPTKYDWRNKSDLRLIEKSCKQLKDSIDDLSHFLYPPICLPRVGCGMGGLKWEEVKPILEKYLDNRFIVVNKSKSMVWKW